MTSYGLAQSDFDDLSSVAWNCICLDEAQTLKCAHETIPFNQKAERTASYRAQRDSDGNRLTELWSIYDFMNKGYLGSLGSFHKRLSCQSKRPRRKRIEQLQQLIKPFY
ncbi:SNF2-related protein [Bacillus licheniformis]|nr:SNF2-related protein [Bacillus licheniformis]